jgi:hypothetical protein
LKVGMSQGFYSHADEWSFAEGIQIRQNTTISRVC